MLLAGCSKAPPAQETKEITKAPIPKTEGAKCLEWERKRFVFGKSQTDMKICKEWKENNVK